MGILKSTSWVLTSRIINVALAIPSSILVARALGPQGKGILSLSTFIPSILALVGYLGINIANVYFVGKDPKKASKAVSNSIWFAFGISVFLLIIYSPFARLIHTKFLSESPDYLELIGMAFLPIIFLNAFLASVILGLNKIKHYSRIAIIASTASLIGISLGWVLGLGVPGFIIVGIIANILVLVIYVITVKRLGVLSFRKFDYDYFRESIHFGIKGHLGNLAQFFNYRLTI